MNTPFRCVVGAEGTDFSADGAVLHREFDVRGSDKRFFTAEIFEGIPKVIGAVKFPRNAVIQGVFKFRF